MGPPLRAHWRRLTAASVAALAAALILPRWIEAVILALLVVMVRWALAVGGAWPWQGIVR